MTLRLLPPTLVNRIAAGEVLERPASAVKELVENALDAGATEIHVVLGDGGKSLISVADNGKGMTPEEMTLSLERFATSKLPSEDLFDIRFLGFRGEALPSIASVSRLTMVSRPKDADTAWSVFVEGGEKYSPEPVSYTFGTRIEVRDLFYAVPARLKFLKSTQTETSAVKEMIEKIALAYPCVSFSLSDEKKKRLDFKAVEKGDELSRLVQVLGEAFTENTLPISAQCEEGEVRGYIALPTMNKATASGQHFFVNGRGVKDKVLFGAVKVAYQEVLASDRYPMLVLFLDIAPEDVDVNVHPTKAEVRFRNPQHIRSMLITAIRQALLSFKHRTSSTLSTEILETAVSETDFATNAFESRPFSSSSLSSYPSASPSYAPRFHSGYSAARRPASSHALHETRALFGASEMFSAPSFEEEACLPECTQTDNNPEAFPPLGFAKAQLHQTYIIAQTQEGIVIVDQHAAHERLTYEKLKQNMEKKEAAAQYLLMSEIVSLTQEKKELLLSQKTELEQLGFLVDSFSETDVLVRAVPSILGEINVKQLTHDIVETLLEFGDSLALKERIKKIVATMACHGSIRAGRKLDIAQMNTLLRQMEEGAFAGQCIHGRPTYIELKLKDIEKLFGRIE